MIKLIQFLFVFVISLSACDSNSGKNNVEEENDDIEVKESEKEKKKNTDIAADNNLNEIADKYCYCFRSTQQKISEEAEDFYKMVAEGSSKDELQEAAQNLSEEDKDLVRKLSTVMEDKKSKMSKCINEADNEVKNFRTKNRAAFMDKLVDEMYSRTECQLAAHVFKAGLNMQKKNIEEEEEDTEDETENDDN